MSASEIPDNQIWYTTNDGNVIDVYEFPSIGGATAKHGLGSRIISNQYYNKGIIKTRGNITQIGLSAFAESNLVSIMMPKSVTAVYNKSFSYCTSLSHVDMPDGVVLLDSFAFEGCSSLKEIKLPAELQYIGGSCFRGTSLEDITINKNVQEFRVDTFKDCSSLNIFYSKAVVPPTVMYADEMTRMFDGTSIKKIYVPFESVSEYKNAQGWRSYDSIIEGYNFD